jgi:hypothetical protein
MSPDLESAAERRRELLVEQAAGFAATAVANLRREFPYYLSRLMKEPGDFPRAPRDIHPAFATSFDWHSCVEMHWLLVRLLRTVPEVLDEAEIRGVLDANLTEAKLALEAATFRSGLRPARPYGWAWALALADELAGWDDGDGRRWAAAMRPLTDAIVEAFLSYLPKSHYPSRRGEHSNTAFGLRVSLGFARRDAEAGNPALLAAIADAVERWYAGDRDYPGGWEPDSADFLSPALVEAELVTTLWEPDRALPWLDAFLPEIAAGAPRQLFTPAVVGDSSDGQIAHLHGLNLSRAWCWRRLAARLPADDRRARIMLDAAARHAEPELANVSGSDYMVEHWLAAYAVLYLS